MAKPEHPYPRVRMKIPIADSFFFCDVRHLGDGYYPEEFANAMLVSREMHPNGFYTPDPVHHRLALVYHAVHHKNHIADEYRRYLGDIEIPEALEALKQSSIGWESPKDFTVGRYNGYWKGATSVVEKKDGRVFKRQVSYLSYPLIQNEWAILSLANSSHFPKVYSFINGVLEMEDCGLLLLSNIPQNWEEQLEEIIKDLEINGITHRDIRIDNLMVKNGVIKLIDFGWAKIPQLAEDKEPPSCLGFPNKPSYGFNDAFSMRSVKKQITYHLEEQNENI